MWLELFNLLVSVMGVLMSLGHFPQALKIYKNQSSKDVSLITYTIFMIGAWIWLFYGVIINQLPIIISFIIGVIGSTSVFILAIKYRK